MQRKLRYLFIYLYVYMYMCERKENQSFDIKFDRKKEKEQ